MVELTPHTTIGQAHPRNADQKPLYLVNGGKSCMAGFVLKNTLSDNGGVTRGICKMDKDNNLTEVVETKNIVKTAGGAEADGIVVDVNSLVSMNMWGLTPDFLDVLENGFKEFFEKEVPSNPQKAEYLIPIFIVSCWSRGKMSVKVLKTNDTWYGMTYHEDVAAVKGAVSRRCWRMACIRLIYFQICDIIEPL